MVRCTERGEFDQVSDSLARGGVDHGRLQTCEPGVVPREEKHARRSNEGGLDFPGIPEVRSERGDVWETLCVRDVAGERTHCGAGRRQQPDQLATDRAAAPHDDDQFLIRCLMTPRQHVSRRLLFPSRLAGGCQVRYLLHTP